ncbi:c-type cytochrome [Bosea sp. TAB14]|jgi:cytochrome c553|uniref:c-type cytochrome n=1 Tax=Bosea sp. TAB14 TaxID=3237481 RepID=UPI003F914100
MSRRLAAARPLLAILALLGAYPASAEPRTSPAEECAVCHGLDGIARSADVPHLAAQNELYMYNQMLAFRSGKRPHKEMRYMARSISLAEAQALSAYYASLPR